MAEDDALVSLSELLQAAPRRAPSSGRAPAPPTPARPGPRAQHQLTGRFKQELSAVDALFSRWHADVLEKRRSADAARDFADEAAFASALLVMNKRGERRRGARVVQGWYFVPRHSSAAAGELDCTRCLLHITRRQTYYVDRAAAAHPDEVCRRCMLCLMRGLLGQDDSTILEEAQGILESAWSPAFNAALLSALPPRSIPLAEL